MGRNVDYYDNACHSRLYIQHRLEVTYRQQTTNPIFFGCIFHFIIIITSFVQAKRDYQCTMLYNNSTAQNEHAVAQSYSPEVEIVVTTITIIAFIKS